ncbi:MAG: flagellar hook-length control protein FliK [Geobacteraceae bacterium GWC2_58_44]|nr:MAG: flagellar hook-length control protein FliK [Geobacteraceae bacterium GWC2_58_44]HBG04208.1 flagellar hook-length control protein FliK [Geobacter sp.]
MFINDETQKQVLPVIARSAIAPSSDAQQRAGALLQLNPGQQVKAEIIANLPNSLYLARIAGEMYKLEIPLNVQPGETMDMTFVAAEPRITFHIRPEGGGESVRLSSMGKWLAGVARESASLQVVQETLLEDPAQGATLLAARLKAALTQGGLFYESHLAKWAAGSLQLGEILKEPQGKLSRAASDQDASDRSGETREAEFADGRTLPLIKEQLQLLNSGVLSWKGEAWPGQEMELSVTEREAEQDEARIEAALSLELPHLGGVEAKLRFGAEGLWVEFVCERPGASALLKKGGEGLRSALASSGLYLNRMAARDGETVE